MVPWFMMLRSTSDSRILSRLRRPFGRFNTELPGVLGVQSLPAAELHDLGADDASNRLTREEALKDVERSEEHTSELQSLRHLVCRLLLEKKKKTHKLQ